MNEEIQVDKDLVYYIKSELNLLGDNEYNEDTDKRIKDYLIDKQVFYNGELHFEPSLFKTKLYEFIKNVSERSGIKLNGPDELIKAYSDAFDELIILECEVDYEEITI